MRIIPVFLVALLFFPGCMAKRWVAPLFRAETVKFPEPDPPNMAAKPTLKPVDDAKNGLPNGVQIYNDVHSLESDVLAKLTQAPNAQREDFLQRLSSASLFGTLYLKQDCAFIYNMDKHQFLALPRELTPVVKLAEVKPKPSEPTENAVNPPKNPELTPAQVWEGAELLLRGADPSAVVMLEMFLEKFPDSVHANQAQVRLVMAHLQSGHLEKAKAAILKLDTTNDSTEAVMVRGLLQQLEQAEAEGKRVKGTKFFLPDSAKKAGSKNPKEAPSDKTAPQEPTDEKEPAKQESDECEEDKELKKSPPVIPSPTKNEANVKATVKHVAIVNAKPMLPEALTLVHCHNQHPDFFTTGVFVEATIREPFLAKYMKSGQAGFMLPSTFTPKQSNEIRPNLTLVAGYRMSSLPDMSKTGKILDHCRLVSLHVIDSVTHKVVFEHRMQNSQKK